MRPSIIAFSLNLTVLMHPMMGLMAYMEAGGITQVKYLPFQEKVHGGYQLL